MAADYTVGVEEEYQLVDAVTGAMCSRARDVLSTDWSEEIRPELQETTLEIGTPICRSATELDRELRRLRFQVAVTAAVDELEIVAAGLHPFSPWVGQRCTEGERYRGIVERYGRIARDEHNFGMHVHVGIEPGRDRIALLNVLRHFSPHLLALSCSSPFFEGEDSGYDSYRMILWRRWPNTGVPPRLGSEAEYERLVELLIRSGAIADPRGIYWGVRPHSIYPTLEFRMTDVCPTVEDAVAIAALARALVAAVAEGLLTEPETGTLPEAATLAILAGNEWATARSGLHAMLIDPTTASGAVPVRDAIRRLIDRVTPVAEALGDARALAHLETVLARGNGADRMRRISAESAGPGELVRWLADETLRGTGIDRDRSLHQEAA